MHLYYIFYIYLILILSSFNLQNNKEIQNEKYKKLLDEKISHQTKYRESKDFFCSELDRHNLFLNTKLNEYKNLKKVHKIINKDSIKEIDLIKDKIKNIEFNIRNLDESLAKISQEIQDLKKHICFI